MTRPRSEALQPLATLVLEEDVCEARASAIAASPASAASRISSQSWVFAQLASLQQIARAFNRVDRSPRGRPIQ